MSEERLGEFSLIERFFAPLATYAGAAGLKDDAAVLQPEAGHELVLTKDMLAGDIHFFSHDDPVAVAQKALRVNLSDLAAKGAVPLGYLLGLGLPKDFDVSWVEGFCAGLKSDQELFGFPLLGGDTIRSPDRILLSVTAIGQLPMGATVRRHSAQAGAALYVTGTLGDSALGLRLRLDSSLAKVWGLDEGQEEFLLERYLLPQPRVVGAEAVRQFACASMDISDGLLGDLAHMCRNSAVGAIVDMERLPLSPATQQALSVDPSVFDSVIGGGDDYELLCAVLPEHQNDFEQAMARGGIAATRIGTIVSPQQVEGGVFSFLLNGKPYKPARSSGFSHF